MPTEGFTIKKSTVFCSCACVSLIMFFVFMAMVICTSQMHGAVTSICKRYDNAIDLQCKVRLSTDQAANAKASCDESCKHDWGSVIGGSGGAPGFFGAGAWTEDGDEVGIPMDDDVETQNRWMTLVRPSDSCELVPQKDNLWSNIISCGCGKTEVQILTQVVAGKEKIVPGCTVVSWEGGEAWVPAGEVSIRCMYIPAMDGLKAEVSVDMAVVEEKEKCTYGSDRFGAGGHYFVIYMPVCVLWCWCGVVSAVGFADQKYQAFAKFKGKKAGGGGSMNTHTEEPSAAVMAAQEWAMQQQAVEGGVSYEQDATAYGNPADHGYNQQSYDQQGGYNQA
eukprot:TRINITY_DN112841_c0_g1_i1.p1 TRINITY_DN112841_c0_g1~~TRINITY_DN112841_c0_g1_i1.p1  ORF type:complete len:335 (-),score=78.58 TRINITY_DN112841_c0_g1_i1:267-1271(-)